MEIRSADAQWYLLFQNPMEDKPAPDFTLSTTGGKTFNFTSYRKGDRALLFFWATWCPHCRQALNDLQKRYSTLQAQGIRVIAIDIGEKRETVERFLKRHDISFEVWLDEQTKVAGDYQVSGVPSYVFVDRRGIVKAVENFLPARLDHIFKE